MTETPSDSQLNDTQSEIDASGVPQRGPERRDLDYPSIPAILEDAEQLAAGPHRTTGGWSFGQIMWHIAKTMENSFDGFPKKGNPIMQWLARLLIKKRFLYGEDPIPNGIKTPKKVAHLTPGPEVSTEEGLEALRHAIGRFENESPEADSPLLGKMTPEEWTRLHIRHSELHMSHVWPA